MEPSCTFPNLLTEMSKPENRPLRAEFTEIKYRKNAIVYTPGHDENLVFIIKSGRVQVYFAVDDKIFSLAILGPGDIYSSHTSAHVKAMESVTLLTIPTERLHARMTAYPALSFTIISILGKLLKQSFAIIDNLVFKDSHQRLIQLLLDAARHNGVTTPHGVRINLKLNTIQIATLIGTSRQTVSKIFNELFQKGLVIKKGQGNYLIPELSLLQHSNPV